MIYTVLSPVFIGISLFILSAIIHLCLMLVGGALAGATTRNGIKHGLLVGVGGTVLLIGNFIANRAAVLEQTLLLVACVLSLTVAGGWFGGHLFPPIGAKRRKTGPAY